MRREIPCGERVLRGPHLPSRAQSQSLSYFIEGYPAPRRSTRLVTKIGISFLVVWALFTRAGCRCALTVPPLRGALLPRSHISTNFTGDVFPGESHNRMPLARFVFFCAQGGSAHLEATVVIWSWMSQVVPTKHHDSFRGYLGGHLPFWTSDPDSRPSLITPVLSLLACFVCLVFGGREFWLSLSSQRCVWPYLRQAMSLNIAPERPS